MEGQADVRGVGQTAHQLSAAGLTSPELETVGRAIEEDDVLVLDTDLRTRGVPE